MKLRDKPLFYEKHALRRMDQRGVSNEQVEISIYRHDKSGPARREGATRFEKKLSARYRLNVIADVESTFIRVVSVFWS